MLVRLCSKSFKQGFSSTWTGNFQMFKLDLEKAEEPEIKLPTSVGSLKKQENSRKTSISASLTMLKPLTVWITTNCGKFFKRLEYQTTLLVSWETFMSVKKQYYNVRGKNLTFSWAPKSLRTVTTAMKLKHLLLGRKAIANLDWVL